jgi:hypothetical protein
MVGAVDDGNDLVITGENDYSCGDVINASYLPVCVCV